MKPVLLITTVFLLWYILSGFSSIFFIGLGIASSLLAVWLTMRMDLLSKRPLPLYMKPGFWVYILWLLKEIALSSWRVMILVWQVNPDISPTLKWVKSTVSDDVLEVLYANSVTLTPGTICVGVEPKRLLIHALTEQGIQDLENEGMETRILALKDSS